MTLEQIVSKDHLIDLFNKKIKLKNTKGVDGILPSNFDLENELIIINKKCLDNSYKFSFYSEKLISKGSQKLPRVLSIATVRDRLVLLTLKEYLSDIFRECVNRKLPNNRIKEIFTYINKNPNSHFVKSDIKGCYNNIDHTQLLTLLKLKIKDKRIISLIKKAISTPTISHALTNKERKKIIQSTGVPQGLAISNILAEIYLFEIDCIMKKDVPFYSRYVDDIMIIVPENSKRTKKTLKNHLKRKKLSLSKEKTEWGKLKKGITFLGYIITPNNITVSEKKVSIFLTRIIGVFTNFHKMYKDKELRPAIYKDDDEGLKHYFIETLNKKITGARSKSRRYGWIPYYSQLTERKILVRIDNKITSLCEKSKLLDAKRPETLKSILRAYYEIRKNNDTPYIHNYDLIETFEQKRLELLKKNKISPLKKYSKEYIEILYERELIRELLTYEKDLDHLGGSSGK